MTFYSFKGVYYVANAEVCWNVVRHEEVGQVNQRVARGGELPVQHGYHTSLVAMNTLIEHKLHGIHTNAAQNTNLYLCWVKY